MRCSMQWLVFGAAFVGGYLVGMAVLRLAERRR